MNNMDEILYWVHTRRAPCLMSYDNAIKRQDEAQNVRLCMMERSNIEVTPSLKQKKRKLSIFEDESMSEKQQHVFFGPSQQNDCRVPSSCKSGTLVSDIDFNIRNSSIRGKQKRMKLQKSGRTLHKKNKIVTSTPLRRSLRRTLNGTTTSRNLNISFESYNSITGNGTVDQSIVKQNHQRSNNSKKKSGQRNKSSIAPVVDGDNNLKRNNLVTPVTAKAELTRNGHLEDLSDVSGFTANYIRSTKLNSNKKSSKALRNKNNRQLVKESLAPLPGKDTMRVCVNKSVQPTLNCSADSSQNVINLITTHHNNQLPKVNKSTSLLKFIDIKTGKPVNTPLDDSKDTSNTELDISLQSKNETRSRYPRRHKFQSPAEVSSNLPMDTFQSSPGKEKKVNRNTNNCIRKKILASRTRRGKNSSVTKKPPSPLLVYSISTEQTSGGNLNVASQTMKSHRSSNSKIHTSGRFLSHSKRPMDSIMCQNSARQQSGFAECFSDSDDESAALKPRKFFV